MDLVLFAIRPMLSASDRAVLSRKSFIANITVRYLSRQRSIFRAISLYNVFSLTSTSCDFRSMHRFSNTHGFFLVASLIGGYVLSVSITKKFFSFSEVGFLPILLRASVFVFFSVFIKMILLSFFNKKWLQ
jgi:hypothetical protein